MSDPVRTVMDALEVAGCSPRRSGGGMSFRCPCHDDKDPSGSLNEGKDGSALIYCHVCGKDGTPKIVKAIGLEMSDLFPDGGRHRGNGQGSRGRRIVATYQYWDERRQVLYEKVRFDPKGFAQRRPDGAGGYVWNLKGVRRVLYRLPDLLAAGPDAMIYIVEGEKDVDRLWAAGFIATCNPDGAGKWARVDDSPLKGRHVAIVGDNDAPGRKHAEDVARRLHGRAASVRIVELPSLTLERAPA